MVRLVRRGMRARSDVLVSYVSSTQIRQAGPEPGLTAVAHRPNCKRSTGLGLEDVSSIAAIPEPEEIGSGCETLNIATWKPRLNYLWLNKKRNSRLYLEEE